MTNTIIKQIRPDFFRVRVPLPGLPLGYVNVYVIKGKDRDLVVDTGLARRECLDVMRAAFKELKMLPEKADFFITHMHPDHAGLVGALATPRSRIYINKIELDILRYHPSIVFGFSPDYMTRHGFPKSLENKVSELLVEKEAIRSFWKPELKTVYIGDGDCIRVGENTFKCIHTPGHSPGHTCLFEAGKRVLISGDHILPDITPNLLNLTGDPNNLSSYQESLERLKRFDIDLILPGHRNPVHAPQARINELIMHHRERCAEILRILGGSSKNAYEVASEVSWNLAYVSWHLVPEEQKWFATGETVAHLLYLEANDVISRQEKSGIVFFTGRVAGL